jgi:hypothetical protein
MRLPRLLLSSNSLIKVQDTGAGATATILATTGSKRYFRGVAFVPTNATGPLAPVVTGIFPASQTINAGSTAKFNVSATGTAPLSYSWYSVVGGVTNPVSGATASVLTLNNVLGGNAAQYYAVVSNSTGLTATSGVVSLSVTDPIITVNPAGEEGLLGGSTSFSVSAAGTALQYQWYFADNSGNPTTAVGATLPSGTAVSGATSSTLVLTGLHASDPTNFICAVTGFSGTIYSAAATLYSVGASPTILAFWDFNGANFNNVTPAPFLGVGSATLVNLIPFSTTVSDPNDGAGAYFPEGQNLPNGAWGTSTYPANTVSNLSSGVQFNVSTAGARDIVVSYESRVSATASDYERLQYTVDGINWTNYPASSTFGGHAGTGNGGFLPFSYNLSGFPGVDNNPNFGIRVVTEFQSTATYGAGIHGVVTNGYVGTANTYGTGGTVTYDMFQIAANAIVDSHHIPTILPAVTNLVLADNASTNISITLSSLDMDPGLLTFTAQSLNTGTVNPNFGYSGTGSARTLMITPNSIADPVDAAPILLTVTDTNGLIGVAWFYLTLTTIYPPPTNTLTALPSTNMLANTSLSIPFHTGSASVPVGSLTYTLASDNTTVIPTANISVSNQGTTNPVLVITPAAGQLGLAHVNVTVNDNNNGGEPKTTTSSTLVMVRPNTSVVALDYFNQNTSGSLDNIESGYWSHLSGIFGQMQVNSSPSGGAAVVDTKDNTENLQAPLLTAANINGVYPTNSPATLYASFTVNMDPNNMPLVNGTYFMVYNDGSGITGDYEGGVWATTNGAAPGNYRIGIENWAGNGSENFSAVPFFPQDLAPGVEHVVVTALVVSNGLSTLWLDPTNGMASPSIQDTTTAANASATLFQISQIELRESGTDAGAASVGHLKIGTSFDAVFPSLHIAPSGTNAVLTWSDPTLGIQSSTNVAGPYTDIPGAQPPYVITNNPAIPAEFFKIGQ